MIILIIAADIGNTNITLGFFESDSDTPVCISRMATQRHRTAEQYAIELRAIFELENIVGCIYVLNKVESRSGL